MTLQTTVPAPVIYTIEHLSTVPVETWQAFVLAVSEVFWQLPVTLRPTSKDNWGDTLLRASELFPEPSKLAFCNKTARPVCLTVERESKCNVLNIQELDFQRQPCDFFARVVMVLLHNLCTGHFRVHSTAEGTSWRLPRLWAERHLNMTLIPPQHSVSVECNTGIVGSATWLMLALLSGSDRWLTGSEWALITEMETQLYQ